MKPILIGFTAMAVGMGLLTASRSTMIVMIGASFPLVVTLIRRTVLTAIAGLPSDRWHLFEIQPHRERGVQAIQLS